jgi:hypothetical protein
MPLSSEETLMTVQLICKRLMVWSAPKCVESPHEFCCECGNDGNSQQALRRAQILWLSNREIVVENKHNFPPTESVQVENDEKSFWQN